MVQEITTQSWGGRLKNALIGIIVGILLIIGAFFLIFWNEGNGLYTAQSLQQTRQALISVPSTPIEQKNNSRVIYISGMATTADILKDNLFDLSENAIQLNRQVQMYQWEENVETKSEKNMGGSETEVKSYTYVQVWSNDLINSSKFKEQATHQNPERMPVKSKIQYAQNVTVGDFKLPENLITEISGSTVVDLSTLDVAALKEKFKKPVLHDGGNIYVGENTDTPKIGDLKIAITKVMPQTVSIIGQQTGDTLEPYMAPAGKPIILLSMGQQSSEQIIYEAESANKMLTWVLRLVSLIMMMIGIAMLMQPIVVLADVIPFLGSIVGFGTGVVAFIFGLCLWAIATAIAWFSIRPLWAIGLILIVVAICYVVIRFKKQKSV
ncbi:MAG: TMEM43 family protein [Gammaproteobacteria bacterium]